MPNVLHINGNVQWRCLRAKGGNWVAECEPLKLTLQAETWGEMMEDIAYTLDAMGNRTKEEVFDTTNTLKRTLTRVFETLNRLIYEAHP